MNIDARIKNLISRSTDPLSDKVNRLLGRRSIRNTAASAGSRTLNLLMAKKKYQAWMLRANRRDENQVMADALGVDRNNNTDKGIWRGIWI